MNATSNTAVTVRAFRAALGWSQNDLAAVSGLSRGTVSRIERGLNPSTTTARKLAVVLGCDVATLVPELVDAAE